MRRSYGLVMLVAAAVVAGTAGGASASHRACKDAGGFTIEHIGPTDADACVLVSAGSDMAAVDVLNNCTLTGGCTTVGANAQIVNGRPQACVGADLNGPPVLVLCLP